MDFIVALEVAEGDRHVRLAEKHGARGLQARHHGGVRARDVVREGREPECGRQAIDVVGLLDHHGNAVQWAPVLPERLKHVRLPGPGAGACRVQYDRCVQVGVEALHPRQEIFEALERAQLPLANAPGDVGGVRKRK